MWPSASSLPKSGLHHSVCASPAPSGILNVHANAGGAFIRLKAADLNVLKYGGMSPVSSQYGNKVEFERISVITAAQLDGLALALLRLNPLRRRDAPSTHPQTLRILFSLRHVTTAMRAMSHVMTDPHHGHPGGRRRQRVQEVSSYGYPRQQDCLAVVLRALMRSSIDLWLVGLFSSCQTALANESPTSKRRRRPDAVLPSCRMLARCLF